MEAADAGAERKPLSVAPGAGVGQASPAPFLLLILARTCQTLFKKRPYNALKEMISDTRTKSICKNLPATLFRVTTIWKRDNPQQVPDAPSGGMTTDSP